MLNLLKVIRCCAEDGAYAFFLAEDQSCIKVMELIGYVSSYCNISVNLHSFLSNNIHYPWSDIVYDQRIKIVKALRALLLIGQSLVCLCYYLEFIIHKQLAIAYYPPWLKPGLEDASVKVFVGYITYVTAVFA